MGFEPLSTEQQEQQPISRASRFVPLQEEQPFYQHIDNEEDGDETIVLGQETIKAPKGMAAFFSEIENDEDFDMPAGVFEEAAANFEVQAAWTALLANAYGLVPDDEINNFVADRSKAFASAQKRQPEYMKEFTRRLDEAEGFFESAGVFLSNPRALGRTAITQSANATIPLITTYLGAKTGAGIGAATGVVAGNLTGVGAALPEELITAPVGATVGGLVGSGTGAFVGTAFIEIGAEIDGMIREAGFDTSDAGQVLQALQNDELMADIRAKAERKGITTASVDALFQFFGGRFVKAAQNAALVGKTGAAVADVGVQSIGEGVGEAAGQYAKDGTVNFKEAALEAVASIAQSAGQTAIGASVQGGKAIAEKVSDNKKTDTPKPVKLKNEGDVENISTGKPVSFDFVRNTESASKSFGEPKSGDKFMRDIEPSGRYMNVTGRIEKIDTSGNLETGSVTFENPIVIENENSNWKKNLSEKYDGKTGKSLTDAIIQDGHDGIITTETSGKNKYISEVVDFTIFNQETIKPTTSTQEAIQKPEQQTLAVDPNKTYSRLEIASMNPEQRKMLMDEKLKTAKSKQHKENIRRKYNDELNEVMNLSRKNTIRGKISDTMGDLNRMVNSALTPISSRIERISPKIKARLRRFEFTMAQQVNKDRATAEPFLRKFSTMDDADKTVLDYAMKNGDVKLVNEVAEKYNMVEEVAAIRNMLEEIYQRAEAVGYDIGYKKNFFPRHVNDHEGLVEYFEQGEMGSQIIEAIHKKQLEIGELLSTEEKAQLINTLLRGYKTANITLSQPSALKERSIDRVTPEINQFYDTSDQSLIRYISTVNEAIEARRFFGKTDKTLVDASEAGKTKDINDSIGFFVLKELEAGNITASQAKELGQIMQARFNRGKMSQFWRVYKNVSYIDTMGSPTSALTQIGDLGFAMYRNGVYRTLKVLPKAVMGKSEITREDIGVEKIAAEFEDTSKSAKAVDWVFRKVGLNKMDALGKETLINGSLDRYRKQAKNPSKEFRAELELIFEGETDSVIQDLQNGVNSENVKLLLMNELMNFQPVALSEMPEAYLKSGNGRIFYMLKSFTIKQFDIYRNEVFNEIRNGNPVKGMQNLTRLLFFFIAANAGADFLKDLLLGRETPPEDYVVNNILRVFGASKFQIYTARREGIGTAAGKTILPPFKFIDGLYKDINKAAEGNLDVEDAKSFTSVPVAGKLYYWWFGGGTAHGSKSNNNKKKKEGF